MSSYPPTDESLPQSSRAQQVVARARRTLPLFGGLLAALLLFLAVVQLRSEPEPLAPADVDAIVADALAAVTPAPPFSAEVYQRILPSLVVIETEGLPRDDGGQTHGQPRVRGPQFVAWRVGVPQQRGERTGLGSGVIVSGDGAILTALHIVEGAPVIRITFADGTESTARIVAFMPDNDIAVLLPDDLPETFAPAVLGSPGAMRVGDEVYVVGNPLGLAGSLSAGVVSGFERTYRPTDRTYQLDRLIQFDAAVNLGTAGGPLLNRNGEVVGIVVGLINPTAQETFIGIGFAVRIDQAATAAGAPDL